MKVLVGCEFSGIVRDAFLAAGHDAISCDLLPSDRPGPHIQGDIFGPDVLDRGWDLLVFFWPCTNLCVSGARWWPMKREAQERDIEAFVKLATYPGIPRIAGENPVGILSRVFRKPDQIIQPYQFGHPESKQTCLWLKNLPKLVPTDVLSRPSSGYWENQTPSGQNRLGPSEDRWKLRSQTYPGIAQAMAEQWGKAD